MNRKSRRVRLGHLEDLAAFIALLCTMGAVGFVMMCFA